MAQIETILKILASINTQRKEISFQNNWQDPVLDNSINVDLWNGWYIGLKTKITNKMENDKKSCKHSYILSENTIS